MVAAKNDMAYNSLHNQFKERVVNKRYAAIAVGAVDNNGPDQLHRIIKNIMRHPHDVNKMVISKESGKEAITEFYVKQIYKQKKERYSLLDVKILTGRYISR